MIKKFLPQSLLGRSILILTLPVLVLQVFMIYMFFERHWSKMTDRLAFAVAGEVAAIADVIDAAPDPSGMLESIQRLAAKHLDMLITLQPARQLEGPPPRTTPMKQMVIDNLSAALTTQVARPFSVRIIEDDKAILIEVQVRSGVLSVTCLQRRLYSSSSYIFLLWMVGTSGLLTVISLMFMRNQIRPLRKLAVAADRFGRGLDTDNFKVSGAREVRQASQAFIDMRDRIKRQVEGRTIMLAGVSHDLRTPLTRLKLGLSLLGEQKDIQDMQADIDVMDRMINTYLDFARTEGIEKPSITNISTLLERLGRAHGVSPDYIDVADGIYASVRAVAIERALGNILSNAIKHANQRVTLWARAAGEDIEVRIDDDGPGIPAEQYDHAFKPFVRLDTARHLGQDSGVGLGLAIAQELIGAHGGRIMLEKSPTLGGLGVIVQLPK